MSRITRNDGQGKLILKVRFTESQIGVRLQRARLKTDTQSNIPLDPHSVKVWQKEPNKSLRWLLRLSGDPAFL